MQRSRQTFWSATIMSSACASDGATTAIFPVAGEASRAAVRVYPNPATNLLHIESPTPVRTQIWGVDGRLLMDETHKRHVGIQSLRTGVYMVRILDDTGVTVLVERMVKVD